MICDNCAYWRDGLVSSKTGLPLAVKLTCMCRDVKGSPGRHAHLLSCPSFVDNSDLECPITAYYHNKFLQKARKQWWDNHNPYEEKR